MRNSWSVHNRSSLTLVTIASFIMGLFASNVLSRWYESLTMFIIDIELDSLDHIIFAFLRVGAMVFDARVSSG